MNASNKSAPGRVITLNTLFCRPIIYRRFPATQPEQVLLLSCKISGNSHWQRFAAGFRGLMICSIKTYSFAAFWVTGPAANGCGVCHVPTCPKGLPWKPSHRTSVVARGLRLSQKRACSTPALLSKLLLVSPHTIHLLPGVVLRSTNSDKGQVCSTTGMPKGSVDGGYVG